VIAAGFSLHTSEFLGLVAFVGVVAGMIGSAWRTFTAPAPLPYVEQAEQLARSRR
jgi:hypothetical protein